MRVANSLPSWSLPSSSIGIGLLCLFAQPCSAVGVLFAHLFPVGQVLRSIYDGNQSTDFWPVNTRVGKDASGVQSRYLGIGEGHVGC